MITYVGQSTCVNPLESRGNYDATPNNMKLVQWLLMGGWWHWYSEEGTGRGLNPPRPLLTIPNVTAHPSTASVPITILLYDRPLLCGFNVEIKGLTNYIHLNEGKSMHGLPSADVALAGPWCRCTPCRGYTRLRLERGSHGQRCLQRLVRRHQSHRRRLTSRPSLFTSYTTYRCNKHKQCGLWVRPTRYAPARL